MPKPYLFSLSKYTSLQESANFLNQPSPHFSVVFSYQLMLSMFPFYFISILFCILPMFAKLPPGTHRLCIYTVELRAQSVKIGERWSRGTAWAMKIFQAAKTLVYVLWKPFDTDQSLSIQVSSQAFSLHVFSLSSCRLHGICSLSSWQQAHKKLWLVLHELPQKNPHWMSCTSRNYSHPKESVAITITIAIITINISSQLPNT